MGGGGGDDRGGVAPAENGNSYPNHFTTFLSPKRKTWLTPRQRVQHTQHRLSVSLRSGALEHRKQARLVITALHYSLQFSPEPKLKYTHFNYYCILT